MAIAQLGRPTLTTPNGNLSAASPMQETLHLPDKLPFWMRVREYLWKGWNPVTVNKNIDSVTMPKWIAVAILGSVLAFGVQQWWRSADQRDMLIELKTEIRIAKEYDAERAKQLKEQADLNKVYIDNMTAQLNVIKGMLSQQQLVVAERKGN